MRTAKRRRVTAALPDGSVTHSVGFEWGPPLPLQDWLTASREAIRQGKEGGWRVPDPFELQLARGGQVPGFETGTYWSSEHTTHGVLILRMGPCAKGSGTVTGPREMHYLRLVRSNPQPVE